MSADRRDMPPVRLLPDAELAALALAAPLLDRASRLARWAAPRIALDAVGELTEEELPRAVAALGLADQPGGVAETAEAWAFAVDTGLVDIAAGADGAAGAVDRADADGAGDAGDAGGAGDAGDAGGAAEPLVAVPGTALELLGGPPGPVLELWRSGFEAVLAEVACAVPDGAAEDGGADDGETQDGGPAGEEDWDPLEEAAFLDGALANLYLLTALEETRAGAGADLGRQPAPAPGVPAGGGPVPLPVLAASMVVPDEMQVPTDDVLEEVSEAMMRLDDHFRLLAATGIVDYRPVDDALIAEEADEDVVPPDPSGGLDEEEVSRYGMVRLTPLGVFAVRDRLLAAGTGAPAIGDLTDRDAGALLDALVAYPQHVGREEAAGWLADREPREAARALLAAARGSGPGAPARRLACQQTLSRLGASAEPAVREVLADRELGGLARVWLAERGAADVPTPDQEMVFWLTVDTLAAQLDVDDDPELLRELVVDLVARHEGFFDAVWRVDHPDTGDVLEAMGRLHPDRAVAKEARKAAFKARSAG